MSNAAGEVRTLKRAISTLLLDSYAGGWESFVITEIGTMWAEMPDAGVLEITLRQMVTDEV